MWEWRESTTRGGWRLDAYGTWIWEEPSPLDRAGAGTDALRGYRDAWGEVPPRPLMGADVRSGVEAGVGAGVGGGVDTASRAGARRGGVADDPTPIFHALTVDRGRRTERRAPGPRANDPWATADAWSAAVPEPHPGSGALPVQRPDAAVAGKRGLGAVPTVPAPPMPGEAEERGAESPEDELMRRAQRRRSPRLAEPAGSRSGRHALLPREEPAAGRHALRR